MAFADYKTIDSVVKKFKLHMVQATAVTPAEDAPPFPDYFLDELQFSLDRLPLGRHRRIEDDAASKQRHAQHPADDEAIHTVMEPYAQHGQSQSRGAYSCGEK